MTELPIKRMDTKLGFTFQSKEFLRENNSHLLSKISMNKLSSIARDWSQYLEYYPIRKKNGEEFSLKCKNFISKYQIIDL